MKFDKEAARGAGYTNETIEYVSGNVDGINDMILTQGAILADDFSATIYMKSNRAAKGESKVVAWPYGPVQIYMNSEEAAEISEVLEGLSWVCGILSLISLSKKAKPILGEACGVASFIGGILISMYTAQLRVAEKGGKGIVLNAQQADSSGTNVAVWIHSQ